MTDTCRLNTSLQFSGAIDEKLVLDDVELSCGEIQDAQFVWIKRIYIPSNAKTTIAAFEHYFAGGGFQIAVRREDDVVIVDQRQTIEGTAEEPGGCEGWKETKKFAVSKDIVVDIQPNKLQRATFPDCMWK